MRKAFLFDLDGTLLPLDMDAFLRTYNAAITKSGFYERICKSRGKEIFNTALIAMIKNDGSAYNKEIFFQKIERMAGVNAASLIPHMERFYSDEFNAIKACTRKEIRAKQTIKALKQKGYTLVLATNPLFPSIATDKRIEWAGLSRDDFEHVTYYENSRYCKPNPKYYMEILDHMGLTPDECYIVGNDIVEDMSAVALGLEGFLVVDHLIGDIERAPECKKGDYSDLLDFAKSLPTI